MDAAQGQIIVRNMEAAEVGERESVVGSKRQQWWLWHASDHRTRQVSPMSLVHERAESFWNAKHSCSPLASHACTQTDGVPTVVTVILTRDRTPTHYRACPDQTLGMEDHLFFPIYPEV